MEQEVARTPFHFRASSVVSCVTQWSALASCHRTASKARDERREHKTCSFDRQKEKEVVTCFIRYVLHPSKLREFETYGKLWIPLVEKFGGQHHGYFLPSEGASNIALALFSFPSLAEYEQYRQQSFDDPACLAAFKYAEETQCIVSYERTFFRPVFSA